MSLIDKLTVKPLLWVAGLLLVIAIALVVALVVQGARHSAAIAQAHQQAESWRVLYSGSNTRVQELTAANQGWSETADQLQAALKEAQEQATAVREQSQRAIAQAEADAADAEQTLTTFMTRYQVQSRKADCALALQEVQRICPAFTGY